jgi:hypothetical protein
MRILIYQCFQEFSAPLSFTALETGDFNQDGQLDVVILDDRLQKFAQSDILPTLMLRIESGLLASQSRYCVGLHEL